MQQPRHHAGGALAELLAAHVLRRHLSHVLRRAHQQRAQRAQAALWIFVAHGAVDLGHELGAVAALAGEQQLIYPLQPLDVVLDPIEQKGV